MICQRHGASLVPMEAPVFGGFLMVCPVKGCDSHSQPSRQAANASNTGEYGYEQRLIAQLREMQVPDPTPEHVWHDTRGWRFDLAWPDIMVAVEVEGEVHRIASRFEGDLVKYTLAAAAGWCVLRYATRKVRDGSAAADIAQIVVERYGRNAVRE